MVFPPYMYCMVKQKTRIKTAHTQLKSVRIPHEILKGIPEDVPFSELVTEALKRELTRLRREAKVSQ